jgi:hypothetical protein
MNIEPTDTLQSCVNRILQSGDTKEPVAQYLAQVIQRFSADTMPLQGRAQLGQVELQAKLDDPSVPGMQGGAIVIIDPGGSKASLALADLYIIWTNKGDTARTAIYVDASGDLYAYQLTGPNAGKRVDFCKGSWR